MNTEVQKEICTDTRVFIRPLLQKNKKQNTLLIQALGWLIEPVHCFASDCIKNGNEWKHQRCKHELFSLLGQFPLRWPLIPSLSLLPYVKLGTADRGRKSRPSALDPHSRRSREALVFQNTCLFVCFFVSLYKGEQEVCDWWCTIQVKLDKITGALHLRESDWGKKAAAPSQSLTAL